MEYEVKKEKLQNGSEILFINVPNSSSCYFGFGVRAGSDYAPKGKEEIAHLLEHMFFKGSKSYSSEDEFSFNAEKNGIRMNARTGRKYISFMYLCGKDYLSSTIDLGLAQLTSPLLPESALENEKKVIRRELEPYLDQIYDKAFIKMRELLSPWSPSYEKRILSLQNITMANLRDFYSKYFVSKNTKFVVSGSFTKKEMDNIRTNLENKLRIFKSGEEVDLKKHVPKKQDYAQKAVANDVDRAERNAIIFSLVNTNFSDLHSPEMRIFRVMLGAGTYSRLFRIARGLGISYSIKTSYSLSPEYSDVTLRDVSERGQSLKILDTVLGEIKDIYLGNYTDEELERAKGYSRGILEQDIVGPIPLTKWFVNEFYEDDPATDVNKYLDSLAAVSRQSLDQKIKEFIDNGDWVFSLVGPSAKKDLKRYTEIINNHFPKK